MGLDPVFGTPLVAAIMFVFGIVVRSVIGRVLGAPSWRLLVTFGLGIFVNLAPRPDTG